ncbi:MAG: class I SAM-dependent methyltransferase [Cytophagaceae bacterium]|nr:class I SAM-dependent methyltransferase [Cytophagaceae bacterium]
MDLQELAKQLRKPEGAAGIEIGSFMQKGNAYQYSLVYEVLSLRDHDKILEIGFGNGYHIPELMKKASGMEYYGLDYSDLMVNEAKKVIEDNKVQNVEVICGNISAMPFGENSFDKIFTVNTVYFWEKPLENAKEALRILKPGGSFIVSFRPKHIMNKLEVTNYGFKKYEAEDLKDLLQSAGFKNIQSKYREEPPVMRNDVELILGSCSMSAQK